LAKRVRNAVEGERLARSGMFDTKYLSHLFDAHYSGVRDYSTPLWSVLVFDAFLRKTEAADFEEANAA
jgi:asparagine synthase (glutamine-hydrolysing)